LLITEGNAYYGEMEKMTALSEGSRERVYYLYDSEMNENVKRLPDMDEIQKEARKLNNKKNTTDGRFKTVGGWIIHKV
jgi:hypothetical protein